MLCGSGAEVYTFAGISGNFAMLQGAEAAESTDQPTKPSILAIPVR